VELVDRCELVGPRMLGVDADRREGTENLFLQRAV